MSTPAVLRKADISRSFGLAADSYDSAAGLQRQVGRRLLEKFPVCAEPGRILDVGCGTGFLTGLLAARSASQPVLALDIAQPMLQAARLKNRGMPVAYLCADAENLPFADHSLQQVYSNLALQWCQNLNAVFTGVRRLLQSNGQWVFSTFGPDTLNELRAAWARVDDFAHVNDFFSIEQLRDHLYRAGFASFLYGSS